MRGPLCQLACATLLAAAAALMGCTPVRLQETTRSFVPPSPRPVPTPELVEPPALVAVESHGRLHITFRPPATSAAETLPGWVTLLTREADWHFQAGQQAFQQGDFGRARREFDRALDILLAPRQPADRTAESVIEKKVEELVRAIHRFDLMGLAQKEDEAQEPDFPRSPLDDIPAMTFPIDPALRNRVLEEVRATCSQLPLVVADPVLAYIRYFSSGRGRQILVNGLRRSGRYRALIQRILDEEGLPPELIHVAQAESGFSPRAVSRKRATGLWQFVKSRAIQYGLKQTPYSDERMDPEKSTRAAAQHLRDLYHQFGDWYLALAAYNAGPAVIARAVERTGYADFWELRKRNVLPKETSNYVPIILALTIMAKNPAAHGLEDIFPDPPLEHDSIEITAPTSLALVADLIQCPLVELRELNPALLKDVAPAGYWLHVPKGTGQQLAPMLATIPPERRQSSRVHRVAAGETLASIARRYAVPEGSLLSASGEREAELRAGDLVLVPAGKQVRSKPVRTATALKGSRARSATSASSASRQASATGHRRAALFASLPGSQAARQ